MNFAVDLGECPGEAELMGGEIASLGHHTGWHLKWLTVMRTPDGSYDYRVSVRIQIVGDKICKGLLTFYFKLWNKRIKTTT